MNLSKLIRSSLALLLTISVVLSGCQNIVPPDPSPSSDLPVSTSTPVQVQEGSLTRLETAQLLSQAAASYSTITPQGLLSSLQLQGEDPEPSASITRIEMLVMLSTAFGYLPAPDISACYANPIGYQFTDLPDWAQAPMQNLMDAGLITGEETGSNQALLHPDEPVTREELETMIRRVYAYLGEREQDDFWATATRSWRQKHSIFSGYGAESPLTQITRDTISQVAVDVMELVQRENLPSGSDEEKIANFYHCYMDASSRNQAGNQPLLPYLTAFSQAQTLDALLQALYTCFQETGITLLYDFTPTVDNQNSESYILSFTYASISMTKDILTQPVNQTLVDGFSQYLTEVFLFAGCSQQQASERAEQVVSFNLEMAPLEWSPEQSQDVDNTYNLYTLEQLQEMFESVDLSVMLEKQGYTYADAKKVLVSNPATLQLFASKCNDQNLELLKSLCIANLVGGLSPYLTTQLNETANAFQNLYTGTSGDPTLEEYAYYYTRNVLSDEINRYYAHTYCSAEDKQQVTEMVQEILEVFRQRIDRLSWMSPSTKENAKKKLDTMRIQVGYPDEWDDSFAQVPVLPPNAGENTLIENIFAFYRYSAAQMPKLLHEEVDKTTWGGDLMTANAYYNAICNSITVPAGSFQSPIYDAEASLEENLAGIGFFIAHEITHSFDNNGAKYDENGNAANWWTDKDYAAFQSLCQQMTDYYDGFEVAPGIANNGERSLSENIADLGAMACILDYLSEIPDADYETFFRAFASCWASNSLRSFLQYQATADVHSFDNVRVNRTVSAFEQFYDTFQISETDGMYVAPSQRPAIW